VYKWFYTKRKLGNTGFLTLAMTSSWTVSHTGIWNGLPRVQNYRWIHPPEKILYEFIIRTSDVWNTQQFKCKTHKNFVTESTEHTVICDSLAVVCWLCSSVFYLASTVETACSHMNSRPCNVRACLKCSCGCWHVLQIVNHILYSI